MTYNTAVECWHNFLGSLKSQSKKDRYPIATEFQQVLGASLSPRALGEPSLKVRNLRKVCQNVSQQEIVKHKANGMDMTDQ